MFEEIRFFHRGLAGGIAGPSPSLPRLSLTELVLIPQSLFTHLCVWVQRANMDSPGLFVLLCLVIFGQAAASSAGKVCISIIM